MPRQSRVTPNGQLIAVPDRGLFWGNRGRLHDKHGNLVREYSHRAWAICLLQYKNRRRPLWAPGKFTELFFLDEATALAAGHRPCGECRNRDYRAFKTAWANAHPNQQPSAAMIDEQLHADRRYEDGAKRTYRAQLSVLPDGTMVELDNQPYLVANGQLWAWSPSGYHSDSTQPAASQVTVLTPRSTVATLDAGYRPLLHSSAPPAAHERNHNDQGA